jgi:hypothetical protein
LGRRLFYPVKPHQGKPELMAVGYLLVVDQNFGFLPFMDKVE